MMMNIGIGLAMIIEMISDDGFMKNVDGDGEYGIDGERDHVHCNALRGGGWCLEWLHPPPKGSNVKGGRERERGDSTECLDGDMKFVVIIRFLFLETIMHEHSLP